MPRSGTRKGKQQKARRAQPSARPARQALLAGPDDLDGDAEEVLEPDETSDEEDWADDVEEADEPEPPAPRRGSVQNATWRRSRVPYLLTDVVEAQLAVDRAERDLKKRVKSARAHGATWEEVGRAVRMTRQGAAKRFG